MNVDDQEYNFFIKKSIKDLKQLKKFYLTLNDCSSLKDSIEFIFKEYKTELLTQCLDGDVKLIQSITLKKETK